MSIRSELTDLFNTNGIVSFEEAVNHCAAKGYSLTLGTYRVNKSNWSREQREMAEALKDVAVTTAPAVAQDHAAAPVVSDFKEINETEKGYFIPPKMDESHVVNEEMMALFDAIQASSKKEPQNVRLNGPAGCGKTTTAMEFAARHNRPLLVMDCPNVREPRDWFGFKTIDPKTGSIVWHKSLFSKMVQTDNAVVVLDEINRLNPMICNTLLPLLDGRRSTYLEEAGSKINVGKGVVFFATTNEGREFTGTTSLDLANSDRFSNLIEVTFLPAKEEENLLVVRTECTKEDAAKLVSVANTVRKKYLSDTADSFSKAISTRILLNAADKIKTGGYKTMKYTLLSHFSSEGGETSERAQLLKLLQGKFGPVF